ncbi:PREDICTED: caspase-1-like [Condylura cristata]|uniref:caspase-1-like n=1 Tax=Condylura cristata TaxID=143302 RepID=UPI000643C518|nr:PREDICTED: caspase-1-like [Condylura cristata]
MASSFALMKNSREYIDKGLERGITEEVALLVAGHNKKPHLVFPEGLGVAWVRDSGGAYANSSSLFPEDYEDDSIKRAHIEKDFIAFCSSTPDNVSLRHPTHGCLFILKLIEKFQEYAWCCDLEEIFRKVRFSFELPEGRAQMPTAERVTLTRLFYLFPGL